MESLYGNFRYAAVHDSDLNKQGGDVTDAASREPVVLTKHRKPRFVLMSYDHMSVYAPAVILGRSSCV